LTLPASPIRPPRARIKTVTYDNTPPTVTVNQASNQSDPSSDSAIKFTVKFSESVSDFTASDLTISGTASGNLSATLTGSGKNYTATISGMTGSGTVIVGIDAGKVHDASGNANLASTSTDNVVQFTAPLKSFELIRPTDGTYRIGNNVGIRWDRSRGVGRQHHQPLPRRGLDLVERQRTLD